MNEKKLRQAIEDALREHCEDTLQYASSYENEGILTMDEGLVIKFIDDSSFQVTIKQTSKEENDEI